MKPSLNDNFISTKDASEFSGYTSDYLGRLVRAKKIEGIKLGHNWLIDKKSLTSFLKNQASRKLTQSQSLSQVRAQEYRKHQASLTGTTHSKGLVSKTGRTFDFHHVPFRTHALALSIALAVLTSGAVLARAANVPHIDSSVAAVAENASFGFRTLTAETGAKIAHQFLAVQTMMHDTHARVARETLAMSTKLTSPFLTQLQVASVALAIKQAQETRTSVSAFPYRLSAVSSAKSNAELYSLTSKTYAFVTHPNVWSAAAYDVYRSVGQSTYHGILATLTGYRTLINASGKHVFSLAVLTRDALRHAPSLITKMNLAIGNGIIDSTHAFIQGDVKVAYLLATSAPKTARASFAFVTKVGGVTGGAVAATPALATRTFLKTTSLPAALAPKLAGSTLTGTYNIGVALVHTSNALSTGYLAMVTAAGNAAYETTATGITLGQHAAVAITHAHPKFASMYRSVHTRIASTLGSLTLPDVRHIALVPAHFFSNLSKNFTLSGNTLNTDSHSGLAAVGASLSVGEQAALTTYHAINNFFSTTQHAFAFFFGQPSQSQVAAATPPQSSSTTTSTTTKQVTTPPAPAPTPAPQHVTVQNYPTYTTVVKGVSQAQLDQSLTSLRASLLSAMAGMVQPVAAQTATNVTTIQQVNMIQSLNDLKVTNGDFQGGSLTKATNVSGYSGHFDGLTAGTTTISGPLTINNAGTTTFSGPVDASGGFYVNGSLVTGGGGGGGSGTVGSGTTGEFPYYASNGTTLSATSSLIVLPSGNVGVGTSSPSARLSVQGNGLFSGALSASSLALTNALPVTSGGTGLSTIASGALLYGTGTNALATTSAGTNGYVLQYNGTKPVWVATSTLGIVGSGGGSTASSTLLSDSNTFSGTNTFSNSIAANGGINVASGQAYQYNGANVITASTTLKNYYFGGAGNLTGTGGSNTGTGLYALENNSSGSANAAYGYGTLRYNLGGYDNTAVGFAALLSNKNAGANSAFGAGALENNASGGNNTAIGYQSLLGDQTGSYNASLGYNSGYGLTSGSRNVLIGPSTIAASYNQVTTGSNNIAIGNDVALASSTLSNQLNIGNLIYGTGLSGTGTTVSPGSIGIGTTSPSTALAVQGNGLFSGNLSSANLTATGTVAFTGLGSGFVGSNNGALYSIASSSISSASSTLLADSNTFSGTNTFSNTITGSVSGNAGTATKLKTARTINGVSFDGSSNITLNAASSTLLADSNTFSGATTTFSKGISAASSGFNVLANGNVGIGTASPAYKLDVAGTGKFSGSLALGTVLSCTGGSNVLQTDASGNITCGTVTVSGASTGGGWTTTNSGKVYLATSTDEVGIGTAAPTAKLTVNSGSTATTTLALVPVAGQTANILDIYNTAGALYSVFTADGRLGIGTTSPSTALAVQGNGLFSGNLSSANLTATGTVAFTGLGSGFVGSNAGTLFNIASSSLDLPNTALQNSSVTVNGTSIALGGSGTISTASSTLLSDSNTFSGTNTFSNTITGSVSGNAGTATRLQTARTINGVAFNGANNITLNAASSTLLADSNTFSGTNTFNNTITGSISGNAGTVTNGVYTTTFNNLFAGQLAGTTTNALAEGSTNLYFTNARARSAISNSATGLTYTSSTGALALTSGYNIPLTASTTNWNNFYNTPSTQITAGTGLAWSGNTLNTASIPNASLANSSITLNGTAVSLGGSATLTAASSTLLADSNTFSGTNTFNNTITGSISGNAGTVTNGVYTTTFNGLFDPRFVTDLAATTSVSSIATLPNLASVGSYTGFLGANNGSLYQIASSSLDLPNTALQNSSVTVNGTSIALGGSGTVTAASSTLLADSNTFSGTNTFSNSIAANGGINVASGQAYQYNGSDVITAQTSLSNYYFGSAGNLTGTGGSNTGAGFHALSGNTSGTTNAAYGFNSLKDNTSGSNNVAVGSSALFSNKTSGANTALGSGALQYETAGGGNAAIGYLSLNSNQTGSYNVAIGYNAGHGLTTGSNNILIGPSTLTASKNQVTTGSNNIAIGNDVAIASSTLSNQLNIGNLIYGTGLSGTGTTVSTGNIGIGTTSPNSLLTLDNSLTSAGQQLNQALTVSQSTGNTAAQNITLTDNKTGGNSYGLYVDNITSGSASSNRYGIYSKGDTYGVYGYTTTGGGSGTSAVYGYGNGYSTGVTGYSGYGPGILGQSPNGSAIEGQVTGNSGGAQYALKGDFTGAGGSNDALLGLLGDGTGTFAGDVIYANVGTSGSFTGNYVDLQNNSVSKFLINNSGDVGIGTTSPYASLSVMAGGDYAAHAASTLFAVGSSTAGTATSTLFNINSNGNVGIGTTTPGSALSIGATNGINLSTGTSTFNNLNVTSGKAYQYNGHNVITAQTSSGNYYFAGAGNSTGTGSYNLGAGQAALAADTSGFFNAAYGANALKADTTGYYNTATGYDALSVNTTGSNNVANGYSALQYNDAADSNVAIGSSAGAGTGNYSNKGGVYVGTFAGYSAATGSDYNTLVGYQSGYGITSGTRNVLIGPSTITASQNQVTTGSNNIAIGNDVAIASSTLSNQLNIGNLIYGTGLNGTGSTLSTGNIGIGTTTPGSLLSIGDTSGINFSTATSTFSSTGGINLTNGCFAINGTCVGGGGGGGGSGTVGSGTTGQVPYYAAAGTTLTATSSITIAATTGDVGIGSTSPTALLSLAGGTTAAQGINFGDTNANLYRTGTGKLETNAKLGIGAPVTDSSSLVVNGSAVVGTNVNNQGAKFYVSGTTFLSGATTISEKYNGGLETTLLSLVNTGNPTNNTAQTLEFDVKNSNYSIKTAALVGGIMTNVTAGSETGDLYFGTMNAGTYSEKARLLGNGNFGLGTTTPGSTLTVVGSGCFDLGAGSASLACGTAAGNIYYKTANTGNYDVAENYPATSALSPATVVGLSSTGAIEAAHTGQSLLGIVSTAPGLVLGGADASTHGKTVSPVALSGRTPVTVSTANGPIAVGDRLALSSTTPGVAVKALHSGETIGIALAAYSGARTGSIPAFLSSQYWFAPQDLSVNQTNGNIGIGTTTPNQTLTVSGDVGAIGFVNTSTRSAKTDINYVTASTTDQMLSQLLQLKVATYRYKIENQNDPLRLGLIAEDTQKIAPEVLSPSGKGVDLYKLETFTLSGVQALAAKVNGQGIRLAALETKVANLETQVSATSTLGVFSSSTLANALSGFGVLIQKGLAQFGTVVADRFVAATGANGASSAGSATILGGNTVVQVKNAYMTPTTKVFITFNAEVNGSWWVTDKTNGSFRVKLSKAQAADVGFDYFLVQTSGQAATSATTTSSSNTASTTTSGTDTTAPTITLIGNNPIHVFVGATFVDPGVKVTDAVDGTDPYITFINGVQQAVSSTTINTSQPTTYIITYQATDKAGNTATAMRSVIVGNPDGTVSNSAPSATSTATTTTTTTTTATSTTSTASSTTATTTTTTTATTTPPDTTPPVVTLNGAANMTLTVGATFTDPGATATDAVDGNLTSKIKEIGSVDTNTPAQYLLVYKVTDAAGNTGSATRTVTVVAPPPPPTTTASSTTATTTTTTATTTSSGA